MNTFTNYTPIPAISWVAPEPIYGVIIHNSKSESGHILGFKLTSSVREICDYVNRPNPLNHFKAFTTAYDAEAWLRSQLSFEEQFVFHLAGGERICIEYWYSREEPS